MFSLIYWDLIPRQFTFGETFDLFFKMHKVFHLTCDAQLKYVFNFIEHFIFDIDDKKNKPTTRMKEIYCKIDDDNDFQK